MKGFFSNLRERLGKVRNTAGWEKLRSVKLTKSSMLAWFMSIVLVVLCAVDGQGTLLMKRTGATQEDRAYTLDTSEFEEHGYVKLLGVEGLSYEHIWINLSVSPYVGLVMHNKEASSDEALIWLNGNDPTVTYTLTFTPPDEKPVAFEIEKTQSLTAQLVKSTISPEESAYIKFSRPVDRDVLMQCIDIEPRVSYDVYCTGVSAEIRLYNYNEQMDGKYNITISDSLRSLDGVPLEKPFTGTLIVQKPVTSPSYSVNMTNASSQIAAADKPVILEFSTGMEKITTEVPAIITMYRFDSIDKYLSQSKTIAKYNVDPADMLLRVSGDIHVLTKGLSSIELENPGLGAYMIKVEYDNPVTKEHVVMTKPLMVTDISLYMQSINAETLFWANSSVTGLPLNGYDVEVLDGDTAEVKASGITDGNGVVTILTEEEGEDRWQRNQNGNILRIKNPDGETVYIDATNSVTWWKNAEGNRYFSYLYLDRAIYKPTDAISFWGMVQPHTSNNEPRPTEITMVLDREGLNHSVTASVDATGMFHGELPLEQLKSGNYRLESTIPLKEPIPATNYSPEITTYTLDYEYVEVKQFQKPTFVINCESDKDLYNYDEQVGLKVEPAFYDGTALPNFELELTVFDGVRGSAIMTERFMTDDKGVGTISFPAYPKTLTHIPWRPSANRYQVRIVTDGENIIHNGEYTYMPTDVMLVGGVRETENGGIALEAATNKINYSVSFTDEQRAAIKAMGGYYYYGNAGYSEEEYGFLRGDAADLEVKAEVRLDYYRDNGKWETLKSTHNLKTENGEASLPFELPASMDENRRYWMEVTYSVTDSKKNTVQYTANYHSKSFQDYGYGNPDKEDEKELQAYTFEVTRSNGESALGKSYYYSNYNDVTFGDGETMTLSLHYNGRPAENTGRILYTILQDKTIQSGFTTSRTLTFTESVKWAGNVNIVASYFDGTHVYTIRDTLVSFDEESAKLNVEITPGKEKYMPGETAGVSVRITDKNGRGVAGNALISVVDEAVFALREQDVDPLARVYNGLWFYNYNVRKYTTLKSQGIPENGGKGDIGKDNTENMAFYDMYRKNFKDTAAFIPVRTNGSGYASVSFKLPDNTTSWRVTSVSVGDNLYAGSAKTNFASSLPFFISPVVSSKYIEGDDIAILAQAHGSMLNAESEIEYSVNIKGDRTDLTETAKNVAYQRNLINFGKLPVGEYTMVATARYGGFSDTVELPIAVVSSNLELVISRELDLKKPVDIGAMRYPVTISFYDKQYQAYYKSVSSLLTHYCMIANQRMSRFVAKRALTKYMEPENIPQHIREGNDSAGDMQNYDGGIGWNVGDHSEALLTTQVLLIAKDQFDLNKMTQYFRSVIAMKGPAGTPLDEKIAASYLGLAYIGEEVSQEIMPMLNSDKTPLVSKAYLIAALAYEGKTAEATAEYAKYIAPHFVKKNDTGYVKSPEKKNENDKDEYYYGNDYESDKLTKTAWLAASKLDLPDSDMIAMYFATSHWRIDSLFECMAYVTNYDKNVLPSSFNYTIDGAAHTADLGIYGQKTIALNKSEFEGFKPGDIPDGMGATAYFIGEPSEADFKQSDKIKISKKITPVTGQDDRYKVDVTLSFTEDAPYGQYDISDWIPSNARFYDLNKEYYKRNDLWWYFNYSTEGQKMYFTIYRWENRNQTKTQDITLSYFIQKTFDSEAVMDSAYMIHGNTGENAFTPRYVWKD